jgi:glutaminyl-peptide cyclotransferase
MINYGAWGEPLVKEPKYSMSRRFRCDFKQVVLLCVVCVITLAISACGPLGSDDPTPVPTATPEPRETATPVPTPEPTATPTPSPTPSPVPEPTPSPTPAPVTEDYSYEIVDTLPHDRRAFTQGLEYFDGFLYESTGLRGQSTLRQVNPETGEVLQQRDLDEDLFGEGLTINDDRIYQLTWQAGQGFIYDRGSFELIGEFTYEGEGWGLANDGDQMYMSDGSNTLYIRDLETFEAIEQIEVFDSDGPVSMLNELEYIDGKIWANIWMEDTIVVIDPATGWVTRRIDMTGLLQDEDRDEHRVDVLNGIAWDAENDRLLVTGKLWPVIYEIEVVPANEVT